MTCCMKKRLHDFLPELRDLYAIDDKGNVYSDNCGILKTRNKSGSEYQIANFMKNDGKVKTYRVHRLVMMAFRPIPNAEDMEVNHIDGNKRNNCLENLEWVTSSENQRHAYKLGLQKSQKGKTKRMRKVSDEDVINIRKLRMSGLSYNKISKIINTSPSNVARIVRGETRSSVSSTTIAKASTLK